MSCIPGALVIALGLAASAELAAAQGGRVEGRVTAAASGAPIPSAEVSVVGTNLGTRTNPEGRFALLDVPAGPHDLRILAIGYKLGTLRLVVRSDTVTTADARELDDEHRRDLDAALFRLRFALDRLETPVGGTWGGAAGR